MGSFLLMAGAAGKRYALPSARVMIHQPLGGAQGQASDIEIQAREIIRLRHFLNTTYEKHTGQKLKVLEDAMDRDNWMTAQEAKDFNLVDHVVEHRGDADKDKDKDKKAKK